MDAVPPPVPIATWWARRWLEKATPDERQAMRELLAAEERERTER